MNPKDSNRISRKKKLFRGLSIQQRLPLFICILLLCVITVFTWMSYYGIKKTAIRAGEERLVTLGNQLSGMFAQSSQALAAGTQAVATHPDIKKFLVSGEAENQAKGILNSQVKDTTVVLAELLDRDKNIVLQSGKPGIAINIARSPLAEAVKKQPGSGKTGKFYEAGDSVYYPLIAPVMNENEITGYFIKWRLLLTTPQALDQLSQLIGTNGKLYLGNADGSLWTDLIRRIESPPVDTANFTGFSAYTTAHNEAVIASARPIANTDWLVLVELSRKKIMEPAGLILKWLIGLGTALLIAGIIIAWLMSRTITKPLNKLTAAATAISRGDFSTKVEITSKDELGKLGRSFNSMANQVKEGRQNLERKVLERTRQLETANQELEAFSYSVSHDLRAPLRAIGGYAKILKEEYGEKLDDEADRITSIIISKSKMMGQLIDDLITFSKTGRKELATGTINMQQLAGSCTSELLLHEPEGKYNIQIGPLPDCPGEETLMRQVWINLIGNSVKYASTREKACIEITASEEPMTITYSVKDNGVGFDMHYAHKLFGVFERLHDQQTFQGTGIGLAIVKRIIDKHHGTVWAESAPGEGATFYFTIPKNNSIA